MLARVAAAARITRIVGPWAAGSSHEPLARVKENLLMAAFRGGY
jgi:hypothetical protein